LPPGGIQILYPHKITLDKFRTSFIMNPVIKIFVEQRRDDWKAELYLNGEFKGWDCGKTSDEAIGRVIRTVQADINVEIMEAK
jgi:hypothetical protein